MRGAPASVLKRGFDRFQKDPTPLDVTVSDGHYVFRDRKPASD